jgi:hypothetical protein
MWVMKTDGATVNFPATPIGGGYSMLRIPLPAGNGAAHVLESTVPVGLQVMGFGSYTSYQYPGGANVSPISP